MNRDRQSDFYNQAGGWLMDTARRNPEGLLLLAAGCALLLRSGGSRTEIGTSVTSSQSRSTQRGREGFARGANDAANFASEASNHASDAANYATDMKDKVSDTVSDYAQSVSDYASETGRVVAERSQDFARQARTSVESGFNSMLREQPLMVALAGLAAGAAVAAVFPATEIEKRTIGAAGEAMADAAEKAKDNVMEAAGQAGARLKSAADERGLNAEGLKDLAAEVADAFTDSMAGKGGNHESATTVPKPGPSGLGSTPSSASADHGVGSTTSVPKPGPSGVGNAPTSPAADRGVVSATTVPKPGPSGLRSTPSSPAARGGAVRTADIAGESTRGGGSTKR
jgi:hypothetical protein